MAKNDGPRGGKKKKGAVRGDRSLHVRVKTARGRKLSSTLWLERQLNDPYVQASKKEGYRSRAVYKLKEINEKYHFLVPGKHVVDLGAAPGGWSQLAAEKVKATQGKGSVVAVDLVDMEPVPGVYFEKMDFLAEGADSRVKAALKNPADVVLSDMAASSTGHRQTDHLKIMALCEAAACFAQDVLKPGGVFCAKMLQGGSGHDLLGLLRREFATVRHVKPGASRASSSETYVLATGFRGSGREK